MQISLRSGLSSCLTWVKLPPLAMHVDINRYCNSAHRSLHYNTLPYIIPTLAYANRNLGQNSHITWVKLPPEAMHANIPTLWPELVPNMSKTPSLGHACRYPHRSLHYNTLVEERSQQFNFFSREIFHLYRHHQTLLFCTIIPFPILSLPLPMLILTLTRART